MSAKAIRREWVSRIWQRLCERQVALNLPATEPNYLDALAILANID